MSVPPSKPDKLIIIGALVLAVILLLTAGFRMLGFAVSRAANGFFYPYLKAAKGTTGEIQDKSLLSLDRLALARQVEKLAQRNRELAVRSTAAAGILDENRILRDKLKLSAPPGWKFVTGEIILRDPLHFRDGFSIDRGTRDGIAVGDAVVDTTTDGRSFLIGVVRECSARTARISTVSDPALRVSGRLTGGAVGFTNTGNLPAHSSLIRFGMLANEGSYTPGEAVVTTGYERGIPEGIKIGELVINNEPHPGSEPDFSCMLKPAVTFEELRFVTVISRNQDLLQ